MLFWSLICSLVPALAGLIIYIYYLRKGQFEEPESAKYQLFREDDPEN